MFYRKERDVCMPMYVSPQPAKHSLVHLGKGQLDTLSLSCSCQAPGPWCPPPASASLPARPASPSVTWPWAQVPGIETTFSLKKKKIYPHPRTCFHCFIGGWGERGKKERETLIACLLLCTPIRDRTHKPGICPDKELNQRPFSLQDDAPTNWAAPARARSFFVSFKKDFIYIYF